MTNSAVAVRKGKVSSSRKSAVKKTKKTTTKKAPATLITTKKKGAVTSAQKAKGKTNTKANPKAASKPTSKSTPVKPTKPAKAVATKAASKKSPIVDHDLWKVYKRTKDINLRNVLVEKYLPLVRYISERVLQTLPRNIELDDLMSAGLFGLLDAIEGFDLSRGIKFKTYCSTRIRGAILDELRAQDWVPRLVRLKAHKVEKAMRSLESELGREPTAFELAQKMEVDIERVNEVLADASPKTIFSLSEKWDDGDDDRDMEKVDVIEDKRTPDPLHLLHQKDVLELITRHLTRKERLILVMYYYEGLTMREIGDILELTESRVCQIHSNIMQRLKVQLGRLHKRLSS